MSAEQVVSLLTIDNIKDIVISLGGEISRENCDEVIFSSICHHKDTSHHGKKLYLFKKTKTFYCFSCRNAFSIYDLVMTRYSLFGKEMSFKESFNYVCNIANIDSSNTDLIPLIEHEIPVEEVEEQIELHIYDDDILEQFPKLYYQGWLDDHISAETLEKFNIRFYPYKSQVVIPVYDMENNLVGIRIRNLVEIPDIAKYRPLRLSNGIEYKFPSKAMFYGLWHTQHGIRKHKKCVLGEAEKFVLACDTYFGEDNFSVGLFGQSLSKIKIDTLISLGVEEVIIAIDFDYDDIYGEEYQKYRKDVLKMANKLKPYFEVTVMRSTKGHKKKDSAGDNGKDFYMNLWNKRIKL